MSIERTVNYSFRGGCIGFVLAGVITDAFPNWLVTGVALWLVWDATVAYARELGKRVE